MKTIQIPKQVEAKGDQGEVQKSSFTDFLVVVLLTAPSSQETLDKIYDVGKLIRKIKDLDEKATEIELSNDDFTIIKNVVLDELVKPWEKFAQPGNPNVPTGWQMIGMNPLNDVVFEYLEVIREAEKANKG